MVVSGLGYAWVGRSCVCLVCVVQRVCGRPSDNYGRVGLRAGPSRVFVVLVVALFVPLLASVLHWLERVHYGPFPQCVGLVLQVLDSQVGVYSMSADGDCVASSSQVRTPKSVR